jgi:hypothetical protein
LIACRSAAVLAGFLLGALALTGAAAVSGPPVVSGAAALTGAAAAAGAPATGPECGREPLTPLAVYLEANVPSPARFRGEVTAMDSAADGAVVITVRDSLGAERKIHFAAAGCRLPLRRGADYDFEVEVVGGFPPACGLAVRDSAGLLFAGATDQAPGSHIFKGGIEGFSLALLPTSCPSRGQSACYRALYNQQLGVTRGGRTRRLMHPQSGLLDGFLIHCRLAQHVLYDRRCADAGLPAVSWTLERRKRKGRPPKRPPRCIRGRNLRTR